MGLKFVIIFLIAGEILCIHANHLDWIRLSRLG